jgi:hypothetical protein
VGYVWQRWLADEFLAAGLEVLEVEGWENRGRPASTGDFDPRGSVTTHHTGSTSSPARPGPTLSTLVQGRPDLPGPLCQWSVRHDGVVVVIAAGRANHAGKVGKSGVPGMPLGADGNALALGDEVDTDGTQDLPPAQRRAIAITNAVALKHYNRGPEYAHRHQDISGTGKWDLGSLTTPQLRADAAAAVAPTIRPTTEDDMTPAQEKTLEDLAVGQRKLAADLKEIKTSVKQFRATERASDLKVFRTLAAQGKSDDEILDALDRLEREAAK